MQSVNDDMDDLFRRAAENYPLDTESKDWDKVMQGLHHTTAALPEEKKEKRRRDYLWLLLLLPIGFICGRFAGNNASGPLPVKEANNSRMEKEVPPAKSAQQTTVPKQTRKKQSLQEKNNNQQTISTPKPSISGTESIAVEHEQKISSIIYTNPVLKSERNNNTNRNHTHISHHTNKQDEKIVKYNKTKKDSKAKISINKKEGIISDNEEEISSTKTKDNAPEEKTTPTANDDLALADKSKIDETKDSVKRDTANAIADRAGKPAEKKGRPKEKFSYALVIGPDISTVKYQQVKKLGYSIGVLGKYNISKKLGIEAGVMWDYKAYYSIGQYFNARKLNLPPDVKIINVDGYCKMFEFPLNLTYNFKTSPQVAWYASAGVSTYIMHNETYDYISERNSWTYPYHKAYINESQNYVSMLNFGLGYQRNLGKYSHIIFEPYVKLPLKGVGIGSLPLSSTGMYIIIQRVVH